MNPLKTVGVIVLILWMAWVTLQLIQIKAIAIEACGLTTSKMTNGGFQIPVVCPDLDYGEAKQGKPK